jgi:hypothetical protein
MSSALSLRSDYLSREPRGSNAPGSPPLAQRKRRNLGAKIDAWWNAVRTSFTQHEPTKGDDSQRNAPRRSNASSSSTTSTRTETSQMPPPRLPLRHATSAVDISGDKGDRTEPATSSSFATPSGALAPAARIDTHRYRLAPLTDTQSPPTADKSADKSETPATTQAESRRRHPQLSLRLDPRSSFHVTQRMAERLASQVKHHQHASSSSTDSSASSAFFSSPPVPAGHSSILTEPSARSTEGGSGLTPSWENAPAPVPVTGATGYSPTLMRGKLPRVAQGPSMPPSFSMTSIRQHIRQRLSSAKESCDRELRKIINAITAHVESELENERQACEDLVAQSFGDSSQDAAIFAAVGEMDLGVDSDGAGNEAGDEADLETVISLSAGDRAARSRSRGSSGVPDVVVDSGAQSDSGLAAPEVRTRQSSIQNTHTLSHSQPATARSSPSGSFAALPPQRRASLAATRGRPRASEGSITSPRRTSAVGTGGKRYPSGVARSIDLGSSLSRTGSGATSKSHSTSTSRSTSRSRSPMLGAQASSFQRVSSSDLTANPRTFSDSPDSGDVSPFIFTLQEIIGIATEILDTPVAALVARLGSCAEFIQRVQTIGKAWDEHHDWACRGQYVQLLLAVAGLSRVIEWWEAEKGFWNFNDEDEADIEPLMFVSKRVVDADEDAGNKSVTSTRSRTQSTASHPRQSVHSPVYPTPLGVDLGDRFRPPSPTSGADTSKGPAGPQPGVLPDESPRLGAEELKRAVERVRKETLLLELALDGETFQYLSPVWRELVG